MTNELLINNVCVFCGSSDKVHSHYLVAARQMGAAIAARHMRLVYGAGKTGLMGALADGALAAGGEVVGVLPRMFNTPQLAHHGLTRLEIVESMHQRKERLFEMADAFIALPGGFGTFEEFFEMLTWSQIGLHARPMGLLNTQGYFEPLLAMVRHALAEGMIYSEHECLFVQHHSPQALLDRLEEYQSPGNLERWVQRESD